MGVGLGTALLIGAGIGTAGAVAGSAISSHGAQQANEDAMDFNAGQAVLNRNWQSSMYERQRLDQENFYKQYQSPEAIAKQLVNLGVNPATIFSGQSLSGSVPSMPSVPSGSQATIGSLMNPLESYAQGLQGVTGQAAQMLSVISDSKLKDAQTLHVLKQAYGQEFTNQMLEISASIAKWQIPDKAKAEINDLMASAALKNANGKLVDAQTDVEKIMKTIRENDVKLGSQQILELSIRLAHLDTLLNNQEKLGIEQIKTEKTVQQSNRASANLTNLQAKGQQLQNIILDKDALIKSETVDETIKSIKAGLAKDYNISEQQRKAAEVEIMHLDKLIESYRKNPSLEKWERVVNYFNRNLPVLGPILSLGSKL